MKKYWKKVLLGIIALIVGIGGYYAYFSYRSHQLYLKIVNDTDSKLYVLGHPSCIYCNMFEPVLKRTTDNYDVSYTYVNTDYLKKKDFQALLAFLHTTEEDFGTPYLFVTKEGDYQKSKQGYMDDLQFFDFLKNNDWVKKDQVFKEPYPFIQRLTGETYIELLKEKENQILLIGRSGHERTEKILQKLDTFKWDNISFLNPSNLGSYYPEFADSLDGYFNKDTVEMPLLLVIKDNTIVKEISLNSIKTLERELQEYR